MKLIAITALLATTSIANAADIIRPTPQKAPAFNWAGPYVGVDFGYSTSKFKFYEADFGFFHKSIPHKPIAGLYAGYNLPLSQHIILGMEGNIDLLPTKLSRLHPMHAPATPDEVTAIAYEVYKEQWAAAGRVRLGYAQGRFAPYIAGGLSVTRSKVAFGDSKIGINSDNKALDNYLGWNLGAGIDYALTNKLVVRAEYNIRKTQKHKLLFVAGPDELADTGSEGTLKSHQLRIGAAYKF